MTETTFPAEKAIVGFDERFKQMRGVLMAPAMQEQLKHVLGKAITPERLARLVLTQVRRIPKLATCSMPSLLGSVMEAAALNLEIGVAGQCWILPFYNAKAKVNEATFIAGYRGLIQLSYRSDQVRAVRADWVHEGETFRINKPMGVIEHELGADRLDPDKLVGAWALVETIHGGTIPDYMNRAEIESIRARSRAAKSGPWVTDFQAMAMKTVLRRLLKISPASAQAQRLIALDEAADAGEPQGLGDSFAEVLGPDAAPAAEHPEVSEAVREAATAAGLNDDDLATILDAEGDEQKVLVFINNLVNKRNV